MYSTGDNTKHIPIGHCVVGFTISLWNESEIGENII